jgi:hypothetical protein
MRELIFESKETMQFFDVHISHNKALFRIEEPSGEQIKITDLIFISTFFLKVKTLFNGVRIFIGNELDKKKIIDNEGVFLASDFDMGSKLFVIESEGQDFFIGARQIDILISNNDVFKSYLNYEISDYPTNLYRVI